MLNREQLKVSEFRYELLKYTKKQNSAIDRVLFNDKKMDFKDVNSNVMPWHYFSIKLDAKS